jgi:hypothetical protein
VTGYCTVAELRAQLGDQTRLTLDSTELQASIDAASRDIEQYCGRRFDLDASATPRLYDGGCSPLLVDDIGSTSGLVVEMTADGTTYTTVAAANYELRPLGADVRTPTAYAWWWLGESPASTVTTWAWARRVRVTAKWGWSAVPAQVKQATLLRAVSSVQAPGRAVTGWPGSTASAAVRIRQDPDVAALLAPFKRSVGIA